MPHGALHVARDKRPMSSKRFPYDCGSRPGHLSGRVGDTGNAERRLERKKSLIASFGVIFYFTAATEPVAAIRCRCFQTGVCLFVCLLIACLTSQ